MGLVATVTGLAGIAPSVGVPSPVVLLAGTGVAVCTAANLLIRFLRWHYLLRRFGMRLPAPASLGAFVGSFALIPVPLYIGQLLARVHLVREAREEQRSRLVVAFLWERVLDVWALALLSVPFLPRGGAIVLVATGALLVPAVRRWILRMVRRVAEFGGRLTVEHPVLPERPVLEQAAHGGVFAVCALLSLAAWGVVAVSIVPLTQAAGLAIGPLAATAAAARAVLYGALTLVPMGAGVAGLALFRELSVLAADPAANAQVTFVFRAATAWLTVGVGATALLALRRWRAKGTGHDHFDDIDACYDTWLPMHFRMHVVTKKTAPMIDHLAPHIAGRRGLDIGCGRGWYLRELEAAGAHMVGIDTSARQLAAAREYLGAAVPLAQASVLSLPFRTGSFDFAYVINVLHHVPPERQLAAIGEIARLVRVNGLVFVHEMNVINPLFRFYLSYVFPIVKGIEEGIETYLDPRRMRELPGLTLEATHYFTFLPDFVPGALLPLLEPAERRLERSPLARFAAHFLAVYRRRETTDLPAR